MKSPWPLSRLNQGVGKGSRNDFVLMKTILYKYALDSCEIALRQALFQKLIGNPAQCRYLLTIVELALSVWVSVSRSLFMASSRCSIKGQYEWQGQEPRYVDMKLSFS